MGEINNNDKITSIIDKVIKSPDLLNDQITLESLKNDIESKDLLVKEAVSRNVLAILNVMIDKAIISNEEVIIEATQQHNYNIAEQFIGQTAFIRNSNALLKIAENKTVAEMLQKRNKPISAASYKEAIEYNLSKKNNSALEQLTKLEKNIIVLGAVSEQEYNQHFIDYGQYKENIQLVITQNHPDKDNIIINYIKAGVPANFEVSIGKKTQPFFTYVAENCSIQAFDSLINSAKLEIPNIENIKWGKISKYEKLSGEQLGSKKAIFNKYILANDEIDPLRKDLVIYKAKVVDDTISKLVNLCDPKHVNDELFTKKLFAQIEPMTKTSQEKISKIVMKLQEDIKSLSDSKNHKDKTFFEQIAYKIENFCKAISEVFNGSMKETLTNITANEIKKILLNKEAKQIGQESKLAFRNEKNNYPPNHSKPFNKSREK